MRILRHPWKPKLINLFVLTLSLWNLKPQPHSLKLYSSRLLVVAFIVTLLRPELSTGKWGWNRATASRVRVLRFGVQLMQLGFRCFFGQFRL